LIYVWIDDGDKEIVKNVSRTFNRDQNPKIYTGPKIGGDKYLFSGFP